ncbi:MAG TPA: ADP-ribosylglycohydrolase family protein, partial [Ktedonobacteraceae bacterium]
PINGPVQILIPGETYTCSWRIPDTKGAPVATVGIELSSTQETQGSVYLESLTWDGAPDVLLTRPEGGDGIMWRRAWVNAVDMFEPRYPEPYRLIQNEGRGMVIQGTREWTDYSVTAAIIPHMAQQIGLGAHVQGLQRYYACMLSEQGKASLIKVLDGEKVLAEAPIAWELDRVYTIRLQIIGSHIQGWVDGILLFDLQDHDVPLQGGGVALICQEGRMECNAVAVQPVK